MQGTLPSEVAGRSDYRVRIYRAVGDENSPTELVRELKIGATPQFTVPAVTLEKGVNFFTATIEGPGDTETDPSEPVRYVYDTSKPKIILSSPHDGDTINAKTVALQGEVQSRSVVVARNAENGASVTGKAAPDGTFALTLALEPGQNAITLTSTDPAGNESDLVISLLRGSGKLTATLTTSAVQFKAVATAVATDAHGDRGRSRRETGRWRHRHLHAQHPGRGSDHHGRHHRRRRHGDLPNIRSKWGDRRQRPRDRARRDPPLRVGDGARG